MKQNDRLKRVLAGCVALAMLLTMLPGFAVEAPAEAFAGSSGVQGVVTPIPIHYSIPRLSGMTVQAGGYTLDVANVRVNTARRWIYAPIPSHYFRDSGVAMFDMTEGVVEVRVTRPGVTSAVVRPSRAGITPRIEGNTVIFNIYEWGQYVVEFNGDPLTHALQLFANPPFVPSPNARQITGRYDGLLRLNSNETVALMPGSVVRGTVVAGGPPINAAGTNVVNARLEGRGIVWGNGPTPGMSDGQAFDPGFSSVRIWGADGVTIDGIAFLNPSRWAVEFRHSNNVNLHNVKIISAGNNADAITMQSTRNVTVDRSYVRSWDDVIVVKNYTNRSSYNHRYTNLVLWADLAQVMEIGYETNAANEPWFAHYSPGPFDRNAYIRNITFENIDVVNAFHNNVISIHNANRARIEDITWRNIIVDNVNLQGGSWFQNLIGFRNWGFPHWFQGYGVGRYGSAADALDADGHWSIRNVLVDGVWVMGGNRGNARWGFDDRGGRRPITGVTIRRVFWVPGSEPMWANMAGAPGGVSYTASPFEPPPRAAVSQSPAPTPTPTPTPAPTPTPTPPPIQHPPTTGVRLGSDTPAGTTGYIAANLHHWGIVPYPMGGTATQVRFNLSHGSFDPANTQLLRIGTGPNGTPHPFAGTYVVHPDHIILTLASPIVGFGRDSYVPGMFPVEITNVTVGVGGASYLTMQRGISGTWHPLTRGSNMTPVRLSQEPPVQPAPTPAPGTGVRLGPNTPAGTTGYIAANLHHWGIVPYPMGGTATQVRFNLSHGSFDPANTQLLRIGTGPNGTPHPFAGTYVVHSDHIILTLASPIVGFGRDSYVPGMFAVEITNATVGIGGASYLTIQRGISGAWHPLTRGYNMAAVRLSQ